MAATTTPRSRSSTAITPRVYRARRTLGKVLWYVLLTALGILFALPFFWMLSSSLKVEADIWIYPPKWIPDPILWENYPKALELMNFPRLLFNTLFLVIVGTFGIVLSSSWVVYGFSRFRFKGRDALFVVLISTLMLPNQVTLVPLYIMYRSWAG